MVGRKGYFDTSNEYGSGIPRYANELYKNLKRYINIDYIEFASPSIIFPGFGVLSDLLQNEKFFSIHKSNLEYNIIHNPDPRIRLSYKKKNNLVYITTAHDLIPILEPEVVNNIPRYGILKSKIVNSLLYHINEISVTLGNNTIKENISNSDYLICNSTQTKKELINFGIESGKISVINLGIDKRFFKPIEQDKKSNKFIVGYIGGLVYRKNLRFAIDAIMQIHDKNILFEIYGNISKYALMLKETKPDERIKFMGFAPEEKIVEIYDSFDVFVFPSLYEGFGLPILEAQARGLPVITYKYAKIPEEVRKYCFEAESPEHMAQIIEQLKENGYNEKERKKAMDYARSFTWEKTAKETLEVYRKVLEWK
ncbi:MAG: glycosyltransferase family 1 protein [Candidatus Micrarchaeota archaeon]